MNLSSSMRSSLRSSFSPTLTLRKAKSPIMTRPSQFDPEQFFVLIEKLGKGSFGQVYKATIKDSIENHLAVKVINLEVAKDEIEEIQNEISYLAQCRHPFITKFHQSFVKGMKLWMVMELLVGSAQDLMKPKSLGPYPEADICILAWEVLSALVYLHSSGIVHRDLKAANILISSEGDAKLADFGVAAKLSIFKPNSTSFAGTPHWVPPEMIRQMPYNYKADIWSFGITMYELAKGEPPYSDCTTTRAMQMIANNPPPELSGEYSKNFKDFVARCLTVDQKQRPTAVELQKHKFVKGYKKKKGFLQQRIEEFERWRNRGGGSDSESSNSDHEVEDDGFAWDFSDTPPSAKPKEKAKGKANEDGDDWIAKIKPASKAQRRATRSLGKKRKPKH